MPAGKRRTALLHAFEVMLEKLGGRVASFDLAHHATLATRNTAHFADIAAPVVNPWGE